MRKGTKRVLKLVLWLLLAIVILIVVSYFLFSYFRMNDKAIPQETFSNTTYLTQSGQSLRFGETAERAVFREGEQVNYLEIKNYEDGVMILSNTELTLQLIIIEPRVMFGSYGGSGFYLYRYGE